MSMFACVLGDDEIEEDTASKQAKEYRDIKRKYIRLSDLLAETEAMRCKERKTFEHQMKERISIEERTLFELKGQYAIDLAQLRDMKNQEILTLKKHFQSIQDELESFSNQRSHMAQRLNSVETELESVYIQHRNEMEELIEKHRNELQSLKMKRDDDVFDEQRANLLRRALLAEGELQRLKLELDTSNSTCTSVISTQSSLESCEELQTQLHIKELEVNNKENLIQDLKNKLQQVITEKDILQQSKNSTDTSMSELRLDSISQYNELKELHHAKIELQVQLQKKEFEIRMLTEETQSQGTVIQKLIQSKTLVEDAVRQVQVENKLLMDMVGKLRHTTTDVPMLMSPQQVQLQQHQQQHIQLQQPFFSSPFSPKKHVNFVLDTNV